MARKWHACPYLGIRFLVITQPFLGQLGWKLVWELRRLLFIDWWWNFLVMMLIFSFWFFGPLFYFAGKWAWPPSAPLVIWGLQTRKKRGPNITWNFGSTTISNHVFEIFRDERPCLTTRTLFYQIICEEWRLSWYNCREWLAQNFFKPQFLFSRHV